MSMDCLKKMDPLCVIRQEPAQTGLAAIAWLEPGAIVDASRVMLEQGYHLEDVSALHAREGFLVSYFFERTDAAGRIALRILAPEDAPEVPSISHVYPGADWHEREVNDFYGIRFEGHPNLIRLFLPSDMNDYPLRKEAASRAPLRVLFPCAPEAVVLKKDGFTLFDPEPENAEQAAPAAPDDRATSKD